MLCMPERYESARGCCYLVVYIGNSHLLSSRYEVSSNREKHEEYIRVQLTADIMSKVCFVPRIRNKDYLRTYLRALIE